jgi:manganese oxidase
MDGVGGLSQKTIEPGETYKYEFKLRQQGTYMYHSHCDEMTQMALGMMGMFIIHPRNPTGPKAGPRFRPEVERMEDRCRYHATQSH